MGTRSTTKVYDENGNVLVCMYGQYDGYPSGHGQDLADFLKGHRLINGIRWADDRSNAFNGAGCMAAAIVSHFKADIGGFYLCASDDDDEYYTYEVRCENGEIRLIGRENDKVFYSGSPENYQGKAYE